MAPSKNAQHVRDLVQIRLFMRQLIESDEVSISVVGNHLRRCGWFDTLEDIFKEEVNYQEFINNPEVRRSVGNGKRVLALPVADLSIVKK